MIAATRSIVSCLILALCLLAALTGVAQAQSPESSAHRDPSALHFYLITVDVGGNVWDNFGHSALRVVDELNDTDVVYNWGVFEVSGGPADFATDFFLNQVDYRLATQSMSRELDNYRAQRRTVWQDKLNLTAAQKQRLLVRLRWNLVADNRYYDYHYFFDNCTTRIRDYLNEALDGRINAEMTGGSGRRFRDEVRSHYASIPPISLSLDIVMNGNVDREMSNWESLFLPLNLRSRLSTLDSGLQQNGKPLALLELGEPLMAYPAPSAFGSAYPSLSLGLWVLVAYLLLMIKRRRRAFSVTHAQLTLRVEGLNMRLLGLVTVFIGLVSGVFGSVMLLSWFASGHLDLHHNLNLLVFWPTDLIVVIVALRWLILSSPWPLSYNTKPFAVYYLLIKFLSAAMYCGIAWLGLSTQDLSSLATAIVPSLFVFTLLGWLVGFDSARRNDSIF
jgi:hypothetical protein